MSPIQFRNLICALICFLVLRAHAGSADSLDSETPEDNSSSLTILPFAFYSPETKLAFGVYPNYIFRLSPGGRPSNISTPVYYTIKNQVSASILPELYLSDDVHVISGRLFFNKWPNYFYGIGNETSIADREKYITENSGILVDYRLKTLGSLYAGVEIDYSRTVFTDLPSRWPEKFGQVRGAVTSSHAGIGISALWDDRDNVLYPSNGYYCVISGTFFGRDFGGDYIFNKLTGDLRRYIRAGGHSVIAVRAYGISLEGGPPFWSLPRLGDVLRGYYPTRFIDNSMLVFQVEYRMHPIWKRWGLVLFAGSGTVADEFGKAQFRQMKSAAGLGIRYFLVRDEKLDVRADLARGSESTEFYFDIREAF